MYPHSPFDRPDRDNFPSFDQAVALRDNDHESVIDEAALTLFPEEERFAFEISASDLLRQAKLDIKPNLEDELVCQDFFDGLNNRDNPHLLALLSPDRRPSIPVPEETRSPAEGMAALYSNFVMGHMREALGVATPDASPCRTQHPASANNMGMDLGTPSSSNGPWRGLRTRRRTPSGDGSLPSFSPIRPSDPGAPSGAPALGIPSYVHPRYDDMTEDEVFSPVVAAPGARRGGEGAPRRAAQDDSLSPLSPGLVLSPIGAVNGRGDAGALSLPQDDSEEADAGISLSEILPARPSSSSSASPSGLYDTAAQTEDVGLVLPSGSRPPPSHTAKTAEGGAAARPRSRSRSRSSTPTLGGGAMARCASSKRVLQFDEEGEEGPAARSGACRDRLPTATGWVTGADQDQQGSRGASDAVSEFGGLRGLMGECGENPATPGPAPVVLPQSSLRLSLSLGRTAGAPPVDLAGGLGASAGGSHSYEELPTPKMGPTADGLPQDPPPDALPGGLSWASRPRPGSPVPPSPPPPTSREPHTPPRAAARHPQPGLSWAGGAGPSHMDASPAAASRRRGPEEHLAPSGMLHGPSPLSRVGERATYDNASPAASPGRTATPPRRAAGQTQEPRSPRSPLSPLSPLRDLGADASASQGPWAADTYRDGYSGLSSPARPDYWDDLAPRSQTQARGRAADPQGTPGTPWGPHGQESSPSPLYSYGYAREGLSSSYTPATAPPGATRSGAAGNTPGPYSAPAAPYGAYPSATGGPTPTRPLHPYPNPFRYAHAGPSPGPSPYYQPQISSSYGHRSQAAAGPGPAPPAYGYSTGGVASPAAGYQYTASAHAPYSPLPYTAAAGLPSPSYQFQARGVTGAAALLSGSLRSGVPMSSILVQLARRHGQGGSGGY